MRGASTLPMVFGARRTAAALACLAVACGDETAPVGGAGGGGGTVDFPDPLGPVAAVTSTKTDRFATSGACRQCHLAGEGPDMLDPVTGEDLSPVGQWRSSMMAFAARDPLYLAVVSEELAAAPDPEPVEALCIRCHGPAGSEEAGAANAHLGLDELLTGTAPAANLGRDGVTCSLCHQIQDLSLGDVESFSGGFSVGYDREMYGPHESPRTDPMEFFVEYTPTFADHVGKSELCATCHTVITPIVEDGEHVGDFVEQGPYLEWLNSSFSPATTCASCHLPTVDSAGDALVSAIATYPETIGPREPFGVHSFEGANAYMLTILSQNIEWTGSDVLPSELEAAAERSRLHLATAADLTIAVPAVEAGVTKVTVTVENRTAHKLPTGYPGRRLWLHAVATDAGGATVFESGSWDGAGAILGAGGARLDGAGVVLPHRDVVTSSAEVALWESVPAGWDGEPTFVPLSAVSYAKDNRILPSGWSSSGPWTKWTHPVGVGGDSTYAPGRDSVTYHLPSAAAALVIELVYESVPPALAEHLAKVPTPEAVRFSQMASQTPPRPEVIATAQRAW